MSIYFSTNIPEMRSMMTFNRATNNIANISQRLDTGQRINSGKDDPIGLSIREGLRMDIKNIEASQRNIQPAGGVLNLAEDGLASLVEVIQGEVGNDTNNGLIGLLENYKDPDASGGEDTALTAAYNDLIKVAQDVVGKTTYNGQQLIGGTGFTKEYNFGTAADGTTAQTLEVDLTTIAGQLSTAIAANGALGTQTGIDATAVGTLQTSLKDLLDDISTARSYVGYKQNAVEVFTNSLSSRLVSTNQAEGEISNADLAMENSKLARAELLSQNSMNLMKYSQSYASFMVNSIFG